MTLPRSQGSRRALSHVGGAVTKKGEPTLASALASAVAVPSSLEAEELARAHVHGFHSYPARMHPLTARRIVEAFSQPGDTVLDPFCGSGTVLVEARLLGRGAVGVDANPLAARLLSLKLSSWSAQQRAGLVEAARSIGRAADGRRRAKRSPTQRYTHLDLALFEPHVLLELDGIRAEIRGGAR